MTRRSIVPMGTDTSDLATLKHAAEEFGWRVGRASDPQEIVAVILHRNAFGPLPSWREVIRRLKQTLPDSRVIACHGFTETLDWGEFCDLGVFHAIRLPMSEAEVRQSLGFLWEAEKRRAATERALARRAPLEFRKDLVHHAAG